MGDVVSLVEKAAADHRSGRRPRSIAEKMRKGKFDLDDLADQLEQMQKMGGMAA